MSTEFAIHALNPTTLMFLLLAVVLPLLISGGVVYVLSRRAQQMLIGQMALAGAGLLALGIAGAVLWQLSMVKVKVEPAALEVGGGWYRVSVPMAQVERSQVRRWTAEEADDRPTWRRNGIGMPGVSLGWFASEQSNIFAVLTPGREVVVIPTTAGYTIWVTPDDPERLMAAIRAL